MNHPGSTKKNSYKILDVRSMAGNPFDAILDQARETQPGHGFVLVQEFEPLPMINMLKAKGFDHVSEKISPDEFRVYFHKLMVADQGGLTVQLNSNPEQE
jgi:hypothetical protein